MAGTVLITGASRGIGRACALTFARAGYKVAVNYSTSAEQAATLMRELEGMGAMAVSCQCDVSRRDDVLAMAERVKRELGHVSVLINNAGVAKSGLFQELAPADFERIFAVNVTGAYNCIQAVLPDMLHMNDGVILNVSSMWGVVGASCEVAYSASKAALIGMTKALAKEVGASGIRVNCVAPGVIDTDMNKNLSDEDMAALKFDTPLMRLGTAEDVANALLFMASDHASFITGQVLGVNGGFVI